MLGDDMTGKMDIRGVSLNLGAFGPLGTRSDRARFHVRLRRSGRQGKEVRFVERLLKVGALPSLKRPRKLRN